MRCLLPLVLFLTLAAPVRAEAAPPIASEIAGSLLGPGPHHGVVWLKFHASAPGGRLARAVLAVDGSARSLRLDSGAAAAVELTWDTTTVHDGVHVVSAWVEDTAGFVALAFEPALVTTDNEPPVAGVVTVTRSGATLLASPSGFDGQDVEYAYRWQRCDPGCAAIDGATHARYAPTAADAGQSVRAVITATDRGGAATARSPQVAVGAVVPAATPTPLPDPVATPGPPTPAAGCAARSTAAPAAAHGLAAPAAAAFGLVMPAAGCVMPDPPAPAAALAYPGPLIAPAKPRVVLAWRTLRAGYGERVEIAGRVADAGGRPVAGATLDVRARLRVPGAVELREGGVGSAGEGRFSYVAPASASRDLTIGGSTVTLLVRAAGTFRATRKGRAVTLSGRLRGGHVPRGGVLVELTAGGRTVRLTRTDSHGAFTARVTAATKLSFRAIARKDSSWPFVAGPVGGRASA